MAYLYTLCAINTLFASSAIIGNSVVFIAIVSIRRLHNPSNLLLCNLTITDFGVGLVVQPLFVVFLLGYRSWKVQLTLGFLSACFSGASLNTMTYIAIDRFLAVYYHLRYNTIVTVGRTLRYLVFSWAAQVVFVLFLYLIQIPFVFKAIWVLILNIILIFTCLGCYVLIHRILRRHKRQIRSQMQAFNVPAIRQGRALVTMFYIHGIFIVSGLPFLMVVVLLLWEDSTEWAFLLQSDHIMWSSTIVFINSCINPYLYCWRMRDIRQAVLKLLGWGKRRSAVNTTISLRGLNRTFPN